MMFDSRWKARLIKLGIGIVVVVTLVAVGVYHLITG